MRSRIINWLLIAVVISGGALLAVGETQAAAPVAHIPDAAIDPIRYLIYFLSACVTALSGFIVRALGNLSDRVLLGLEEVSLEVRHCRHAVNNLSAAELSMVMATETDPHKLERMEALVRDVTAEPELVAARSRLDLRRAKLGMGERRGTMNPKGK